jgi:Zn-dependent protease with chaperone function
MRIADQNYSGRTGASFSHLVAQAPVSDSSRAALRVLAQELTSAPRQIYSLRPFADLWSALSFNLVALVTTPAVNVFTRSLEHNADVVALELTHDNNAALSLVVKYAKISLSVPNPGSKPRRTSSQQQS